MRQYNGGGGGRKVRAPAVISVGFGSQPIAV